MTGQRLRHLLVAAFVADRPTLPTRNAYAMVERVLRTPAGRQLEYEVTAPAGASSAVRHVDVRSPAESAAAPALTNRGASRP